MCVFIGFIIRLSHNSIFSSGERVVELSETSAVQNGNFRKEFDA